MGIRVLEIVSLKKKRINVAEINISKSDKDAYKLIRPEYLSNNKYKVEVPNTSRFDTIAVADFDEMFNIINNVDIK